MASVLILIVTMGLLCESELPKSCKPIRDNKISRTFHKTDCAKDIMDLEAPNRPSPSDIFEGPVIATFLRKFRNSGFSYLAPADKIKEYNLDKGTAHIGRKEDQFVSSQPVMNVVVQKAMKKAAESGNDIAKFREYIDTDLGFSCECSWMNKKGVTVIQVSVDAVRPENKLRMVSGNEEGVNKDWRPGGYAGNIRPGISGAKSLTIPEAVVDNILIKPKSGLQSFTPKFRVIFSRGKFQHRLKFKWFTAEELKKYLQDQEERNAHSSPYDVYRGAHLEPFSDYNYNPYQSLISNNYENIPIFSAFVVAMAVVMICCAVGAILCCIWWIFVWFRCSLISLEKKRRKYMRVRSDNDIEMQHVSK